MKIKESQLRQIIKESIQHALKESSISSQYVKYTTQLMQPIMQNNLEKFMQIFNSFTPDIKDNVYHYFADTKRIKPEFILAMKENIRVQEKEDDF